MEKETKSLIKDYLLKAGHLVFNVFQCHKNNYGNKKGIADLIGCLKGSGRFFAIEVKSKGGTLRDEQAEFLDWVRRTGGIAIVAYSLDDVINKLNSVGLVALSSGFTEGSQVSSGRVGENMRGSFRKQVKLLPAPLSIK